MSKAFQVMIDNNLDFDIALYPYELVTYGETGQVCQNWMQYRLIKKYLEVMTDEQTLVVMSGHPLGLFHSHKLAPRCIISNGLMVGIHVDVVVVDILQQVHDVAVVGNGAGLLAGLVVLGDLHVHLQERRERPGRLRLPLLRGGHPGALPL